MWPVVPFMQVTLAPPVRERDVDADARAVSDALAGRAAVCGLAGFAALSAIAGGAALLLAPNGSESAPLTLLGGTPFTSFVIPGLLLALVVGGSSLAALVLVWRRSVFAIDATLVSGGALTLWIAWEAAILRQSSFLQLVYGVVGLAILGLGVRGALRSPHPRHAWMVFVTLGEAAGFLVPAFVGVLALALQLDDGVRAALLVMAGAIEGFLCGLGQAWAFPLPLARARFAALTSVAAAAVWALAMGLVGLGHAGASLPVMVASLAVVAPSGLVLMGVAQWLELRQHAFRAHRWIAWSALAWLVALPASFAPSPFVDAATPMVPQIVLWTSAGLVMAYLMALVTWQGARRLAG
jgi:hypothetical protein